MAQCLHDGLLCYRHWLSTIRTVVGSPQDHAVRQRIDRSLHLAERIATRECIDGTDHDFMVDLGGEDRAIVLAACETYRDALELCLYASDLSTVSPEGRDTIDEIQQKLGILTEIEARCIPVSVVAST